MKIIFLDIDGVLNDWERSWREVPDYNPEFVPHCVKNFNRIVRETGAKIVISSTWRFYIRAEWTEWMTIEGFRKMLRSHSVRGEIIGYTREDRGDEPRWRQIADWLKAPEPHFVLEEDAVQSQSVFRIDRYCILDDCSDAFGGRPGVQTAGGIGLTEADADAAIAILGRVEIQPQPTA